MVLENLPTKQRTTGEKAAARSMLVRRLRVALPVLAVALIVVFFVSSGSDESNRDWELEDLANTTMPTHHEMANPRFAGVDGGGKPFEITAAKAIRNSQNDNTIRLNDPRAVTQNRGEQTVVLADKGVYQSDTKVLTLEKEVDDVTLEHTAGVENYVLRTPAATVLLNEDRVETDSGVRGEDKNGNTLSADKMKAYQDEGRVVFEGNVKLKIYQTPDNDDGSGSGGLVLRNVDAPVDTDKGSPQ